MQMSSYEVATQIALGTCERESGEGANVLFACQTRACRARFFFF